MSKSIKPTPGPWHVANGVQIRGEREQIAKVWMMRCGEGKANASLIAEAGTVCGETGLTPRQLAERVKELEELLNGVLLMGRGTSGRIIVEGWQEEVLRAALSNALPNAAAKEAGK